MNRVAALALALTLAGCGGGSSPASGPATPVQAAQQSGTLSLSIPLTGGSTSASAARRAAFVSPNAATAVITVNGGAGQNVDVSATSTVCTTSGSTRTCAIPLTLPTGANTVAISLMGPPNGTKPGLLLGQGSSSVTVVAGTPFTVTLGINPAISGILSINPTNFATLFSYGKAANQSVTLTFSDPSGAPITGTGAGVPSFLMPVTLTSSDPHLTFSPSTGLTQPGQPLVVQYDGSPAIASSVTITLSFGGTSIASTTFSLAGLVVNRYTIPPGSSTNPQQINVGQDGNLWFVESSTKKVDRVFPATGAIVTTVSGIPASPRGLVGGVGSDKSIYYSAGCVIYKIDLSGNALGNINVGGSNCNLNRLATDSTGNVWFIDTQNAVVGYVVPALTSMASFPTPTANAFNVNNFEGGFNDIVRGSDNAMYFTEAGAGNIGRVATSSSGGTVGTITETHIPNTSKSIFPTDIAAGSDGNLWFLGFDNNSGAPNQFFAKYVPATAAITEYPNVINPAAFANLVVIAAGPDGNLYIAEGGGAVKVVPSNPFGALTQFFTDNGQSSMESAVAGPDGNVWFTAVGSGTNPGFTTTVDEVASFTPR